MAHEVIVEGSGTAFVISVSSAVAAASPSSQACDRHLFVPIGHIHTQGYFHKYVAFSSFDAAETRWVVVVAAVVNVAVVVFVIVVLVVAMVLLLIIISLSPLTMPHRDWITTIRSCVRDAEWDRDEEARDQAKMQLQMIDHDESGKLFPLPRVSSIAVSIPPLSGSDRIAAMVRGCHM